MPRTSPFASRLSPAETAELQRRAAKYTSPYFQVQRARMILLAAEGLTNDEVAFVSGITIWRWLHQDAILVSPQLDFAA